MTIERKIKLKNDAQIARFMQKVRSSQMGGSMLDAEAVVFATGRVTFI